jgi:uncharacterized membrane protein YkoI
MTKLSRAIQRAFMYVLFNVASAISKQRKRTIMKIKMIVCSALATGLLTGCININTGRHEGHCNKCEKSEGWEKHGDKEKDEKGEKDEAKSEKASQAELMAKAKVSKETAQQTALAKVPNGTIKDGEIENENGKLQWSFDVATPGSTDITEVNIDAMTGDVISVDKESAADEAKEAAEDAKKKKGEKEDKD